jgi:hypothetical protein
MVLDRNTCVAVKKEACVAINNLIYYTNITYETNTHTHTHTHTYTLPYTHTRTHYHVVTAADVSIVKSVSKNVVPYLQSAHSYTHTHTHKHTHTQPETPIHSHANTTPTHTN